MFVSISMMNTLINTKLTENFPLKREMMSKYDLVYIVETNVYISHPL